MRTLLTSEMVLRVWLQSKIRSSLLTKVIILTPISIRKKSIVSNLISKHDVSLWWDQHWMSKTISHSQRGKHHRWSTVYGMRWCPRRLKEACSTEIVVWKLETWCYRLTSNTATSTVRCLVCSLFGGGRAPTSSFTAYDDDTRGERYELWLVQYNTA